MRPVTIIALGFASAACDRESTKPAAAKSPISVSMDQDYDLIPFDPSQGIAFKYGMSFSDQKSDIAAFEGHHGVKLPADFVRMIGQSCEGGFDGSYRVATGDFGRIVWWSMLLMKLPDAVAPKLQAESEAGPMIVEDVIKKHVANFMDESGRLVRFPFGRAYCGTEESEVAGHLAFDLRDSMALVFVPLDGSPPRRIADTFEQMILTAALEFYG